MSALYRQLPAVDALLQDPRVAALPRGVAVATARAVLDRLRGAIGRGELTAVPDVASVVVDEAQVLVHGRVKPVINATGVVLHTNLGRAPWAPEAVEAAARVASGWCDLEMDLETGERGKRTEGAEALLRHLTGAEAAVIVNNCAAAVLLALTSLARGREVVVSRGELVEIGGSFRVPDVISSGGARLVDVGTTNRTRLSDFAAAIGPDTAVLLRVHPSNFRIVGFTEEVPRSELVGLARERGLLAVEDLGSGSLDGERGEPGVREAVRSGMDVVTFSGDKLLGGPQAGIAVGRKEAIARMRKHPLYRALRVDKVTIAALEATLALHAAGRPTPVGAALGQSVEEIGARAHALLNLLQASGVAGECLRDTTFVGGGSLPEQSLGTWVVAVDAPRPDALAAALRRGNPAIVARIGDGMLRLDARTLRDEQLPVVAEQVASALRSGY
jgi:L-seryl-tRNA(Ser) seleniumtransferase